MLCNRFHELDDTRYTTNALNGLNCAGRRLKRYYEGSALKSLEWTHKASGSGGGSNASKQLYESDVW